MSERNFKTREGYDVWDKLCAIPKYGFIKSPAGAVVKVLDIGSWIDRDEAMQVVDEAQSELNLVRSERDQLKAELAALRATHPAPESVEVVGTRYSRVTEHGRKVSLVRLSRKRMHDGWDVEDLMTVAQHNRIMAATVPATSRVVQVEVLRDLLDEGPRAATWAAQDKLRAMLEVKP